MLSQEGRRELLLALSRDYDVNRARVRELMRQYLSLELSHGGMAIIYIIVSSRG